MPSDFIRQMAKKSAASIQTMDKSPSSMHGKIRFCSSWISYCTSRLSKSSKSQTSKNYSRFRCLHKRWKASRCCKASQHTKSSVYLKVSSKISKTDLVSKIPTKNVSSISMRSVRFTYQTSTAASFEEIIVLIAKIKQLYIPSLTKKIKQSPA